MSVTEQRRVFTPSELNREARLHLEAGFGYIHVEGEISNLATPRSGHIYFSLKDDKAQIRCAFFKQRAAGLKSPPADGDRVVIKAQLSLYEPRGDYQLIVQHLEAAGEGELRQAFEALRKKLEAEGLFRSERKRALPGFPERIAVITSATGAAVRDIIHVLGRRWPIALVRIYPVSVQGDQAAPAIVHALDRANEHGWAEVIILGRGGGSLEDMWPFNEEQVVRAVVASSVPVVAAVGHETDTCIAELAADLRAPTPSAAAEAVAPDQRSIKRQIQLQHRSLERAFSRLLATQNQRMDYARRSLRHLHPLSRLSQQRDQLYKLRKQLNAQLRSELRLRRQELSATRHRLWQLSPTRLITAHRGTTGLLQQRLSNAMNGGLNSFRAELASLTRTLQAVNPLHLLEQGYTALQKPDGKLVRRISDTAVGQKLSAPLRDGTLKLQVEHIEKDGPPGRS